MEYVVNVRLKPEEMERQVIAKLLLVLVFKDLAVLENYVVIQGHVKYLDPNVAIKMVYRFMVIYVFFKCTVKQKFTST